MRRKGEGEESERKEGQLVETRFDYEARPSENAGRDVGGVETSE